MKRLILSAMVILILVPTYSIAQRGGGPGGGRGMGYPGMSRHPARPMSGTPTGFYYTGSNFRRGGFGGWGFGGYVGSGWPPSPFNDGYGHSVDYGEQVSQNQVTIVLVMPYQQVPVAPPPPPLPIRSETREYNWPASDSDPGAVFSIVSKDGSVRQAIAVWTQDTTLCFTAPDGTGGQLPISSVHRESTYRVNTEKKLRLSLPAEISASVMP